MKSLSHLPRFALLALVPLFCQCTSTATSKSRKTGDAPLAVAASNSKAKPTATDDLEEYAATEIADPLEGLNRATFWLNDKLYLVIFRPISKGYEKVLPKRARNGIHNAYENVKFPVRVVNWALQGKFKHVGLETEKFLLNTVAGVGGLYRMSDKVEVLAALPDQDTGKTFAKWGMGHGAYIVVPFLGPSSVRDGVGLVGDYALNPVNWGAFWGGEHDWTMIPPAGNTLRSMPAQLEIYDNAKADAIDPYIAIRSAYVQYRDEQVKK